MSWLCTFTLKSICYGHLEEQGKLDLNDLQNAFKISLHKLGMMGGLSAAEPEVVGMPMH